MEAIGRFDILRYTDGEPRAARDELVVEEPLELRVHGRSIAVTMRTPGHDEELAAGFLLGEGVIHGRDQIGRIRPCDDEDAQGNVLDVTLTGEVSLDWHRIVRQVIGTSSCGLCGTTTIQQVHKQFPPVTHNVRIRPDVLAGLPQRLRDAQDLFHKTGGLHAAGVFTTEGTLVVLREDVGRHNAVDKVIGHLLLAGALPLTQHVLLVSGRASFEIVQKALAAQIAIVAAVSAPSSLAVELARAGGQTLVAFLRPGGMNVYSGAQRIVAQS